MTNQEKANIALIIWQLQRAAGIAPEERCIPSPANDRDSFDADLAIIRQCIERAQ